MEDRLDIIHLKSLGVREELYKTYDVIILPENIYNKKENENFVDSQDTIDFYKYLKGNNFNVGNSIDLELNSKLKERRGGDAFWLGVVQFIQEGMIDLFWGLLGSYLYEKMKSDKTIPKSSTEAKTNIHIAIKTKDFNLDYHGDIKKFLKIIKVFKSK